MSCADFNAEIRWRSMEVALFDSNVSDQLEAVQFFRKLLSQNLPVPVNGIVHLVPRFVELLDSYDQPQIQFEVTWALTNVAYGSAYETHQLNKSGATCKLIQIVKTVTDMNVRDQAIWALSNVAGDCHGCRMYLLELGFLEILIDLLNLWISEFPNHAKAESRRTVVWALSNLSRSRSVEEFDRFQPILPLLQNLHLLYPSEKELLVEMCWVLVYLTEADDSLLVINSVVNNRFVELIVQILNESVNPAYLQAAIRAAGNIATGTDDQTQHLLNQGILPCLERLLDHPKENLLREICWLISNITAGTEQQIETICTQCPQLFSKLNRIIVSNQTYRVRKEAAWAVCNALTGASNSQLHRLVQHGSIHALSSTLFLNQDEKLLLAVLSAFEHVLVVGKEEAKNILGFNTYVILTEDCGGLAKIISLQDHLSPSVKIKCYDLLTDHFVPPDNANGAVTNKNQQPAVKQPLQIIFNR